MQAYISKILLKDLKVAEKPYEVRDIGKRSLQGFMVRVQPSGAMSYIYQYGRGKRVTLGRVDKFVSPDQARDEAKKILARVLSGEPVKEDSNLKTNILFKDYVQKIYIPHLKVQANSNHKTSVYTLEKFCHKFECKRLDEITLAVVQKWQNKRLTEVKPETVRRDENPLRRMFCYALKHGAIKENPFEKLDYVSVNDDAHIRYLSKDEEKRLFEALRSRDQYARQRRKTANQWRHERKYKPLSELSTPFIDYLEPLIFLAINTGMRRGEIFQLKWRDVSLDNPEIGVRIASATTKSKKTRYVPLNEKVLDSLKRWRKQSDGEYVFPNQEGRPLDSIKTPWKSLMEKSKISDFRFHDLRHHFASTLVMKNVSLAVVRDLLGHSDYKLTLRYAHLAPQTKADAVKLLGGE